MRQSIKQEFFKSFHRLSYWVYTAIIFLVPLATAVIYRLTDSKTHELDYVSHHGYYIAFVSIFLIVLFSSILSEEFQFDTIKVIAARGNSRIAIFMAKVFKLVFDYIFFYVIAVISYLLWWLLVAGNQHFLYQVVTSKTGSYIFSTVKYSEWTFLWHNFLAGMVSIAFVGSIALMISSFLKSNSIAIASAFIVYLAGNIINGLSMSLFYKNFHLISWNPFNTNIAFGQQVFDSRIAFYHLTVAQSLSATLVWIFLFLAIAGLVFSRRNL
ncbi:ABC transporter permease [Oenococcus alcoholitolerans]